MVEEMLGYTVFIFRSPGLMRHATAMTWEEVRELRDMAIRTEASRVVVMRWRDYDERHYVAGPHELYRKPK